MKKTDKLKSKRGVIEYRPQPLTQEAMTHNFIYEIPGRLRKMGGDLEDLMTGENHSLLLDGERQFMADMMERLARDAQNVERGFEAIGIDTPDLNKRKAMIAEHNKQAKALAKKEGRRPKTIIVP